MPVIGDLRVSDDGRELVLARGAALTLQQIKVGAQIWTGTVGWDPDAGLPMLGTILVKGPDLRVITQIFRGFLLASAGVQSIDELSVELDRATRSLRVRFRGTAEDGESFADKVQFAIA